MFANIYFENLFNTQQSVFNVVGLEITNFKIDSESQKYAACHFALNHLTVLYRVAKITPTKKGLFVTLWKRGFNKIIAPFSYQDPIDLVFVAVANEGFSGQFVFPKEVLCEKNIFATKTKDGKRAFRLYPPWEHVLNSQAQKTQNWQLDYFIEIGDKETIDWFRDKKLYFL